MKKRNITKFYRYQTVSEYSLSALCYDQLYFADPNSFNDPLDCRPRVKIDSDLNELRNLFSDLIGARVEQEALSSLKSVKANEKKAISHAKKLRNYFVRSKLQSISYYATDPEYKCGVEEAEMHILRTRIEEELLLRYDRGVCCFSEEYSNPLMWSHYGGQHKGFCAGYNLNRNPKPDMHKVVYGGSRMIKTSLVANYIMEGDKNAKKAVDRNTLLRKASPWRYEREWRLFDTRGLGESPLLLSDITFGLKCPRSIQHTVISAIKEREAVVKFYEIFECYNSFKLKRRPLDMNEMEHYFPRTAKSGVELFGELD